jgi:hypothetical protein
MTDTPRSNAISPVVFMGSDGPDLTPEAVERLAQDMQQHMPFGRGADTLRALSAERDDQKKARILAVRSWTEDMVSLTAALEDCSNAEARAEAAEAEVARLRYVLGGVRGAIKTGRNEPLQVWLDQINIALDTTP